MMRTALAALTFFAAAVTPAFAERAVIRGLDKVTGHARDYTLTLGRATRIGTLDVIARACAKAAPEETPEVRIYVEVFDNPPAAGEAAGRACGDFPRLAVCVLAGAECCRASGVRHLGGRLPRLVAHVRDKQNSSFRGIA